ncbi:YiiX/YebB-like N1pC/P60 family cysteine hydrolase [Glaciecola sp. SC05]|uniref:YiiX/YebB-like N1pC/P60 family cysteine hydrolase n=1 Tax=Glaciecola sp. SC05 TaxID=1987355 RepID=UPI0035294B01
MSDIPPDLSPSLLAKIGDAIGDKLAAYLSKPREGYQTFSTLSTEQLKTTLQPGDLILVEGNSRISSAIKYLTQSTWSHVCMYIGEHPDLQPILEADLIEGVITVPLDKYNGFNLRICRPVNLRPDDTQSLVNFSISKLGHQYDNKNIIDLMRYLLPTPPVPQRFRRGLLEFGSGDPTKAICSTLVAQAFQSIRYPILPLTAQVDGEASSLEDTNLGHARTRRIQRLKELMFKNDMVLTRRHYSHYTPRDFDLSPYFEVVKPTLCCGFDYKAIKWANDEAE